jgi:phage shock protein A
MALIHRVARWLTADLHAVLDRIEEPDVLLRQAIREMEEELAEGERQARGLALEIERLHDRQERAAAGVAQLDAQLAVCFDAGDDALARKLVKRKLETDKLRQHVAERRAALVKELGERERTLAARRDQLDVLRQKAELLIEAPAPPAHDAAAPDFTVGDDEIEVELLRERQRRMPS